MIMMTIVLMIEEMEIPGKMVTVGEDQIEDGLEIARGIQKRPNADGGIVKRKEEEAVLQEIMMIAKKVALPVPDQKAEAADGQATGKDIQKRQNAVGKTGATVAAEAVPPGTTTTGKGMDVPGQDPHKVKAVDGLVTERDIRKQQNVDGKTAETGEEVALREMMTTGEEGIHPVQDQARAAVGLVIAKAIPKLQNVVGKNVVMEEVVPPETKTVVDPGMKTVVVRGMKIVVVPEMEIAVVRPETKTEEGVDLQGPDHLRAMVAAGLEIVKDIQTPQNVVGGTDKKKWNSLSF